MKKGLIWILNDLQCWTMKKEGRGGRRGEEEGAMRRKERRGEKKNEEVARGRIVDPRGLVFRLNYERLMRMYTTSFTCT